MNSVTYRAVLNTVELSKEETKTNEPRGTGPGFVYADAAREVEAKR